LLVLLRSANARRLGLLELTQGELAHAAMLGLSAIVDFEKKTTASINRRNTSLATRGVDFIEENGGGPGVRVRKRHQKKS